MRLTTKGRFAVTAMIDLAQRQHQGPVTLAGISQRQEISLSYLEQLFGKLRRHEIVESVRGPGGGYNLARRPEDITVADIIIAVDENHLTALHSDGYLTSAEWYAKNLGIIADNEAVDDAPRKRGRPAKI